MPDYLIVTDKIAPLSDAESARGALGLASALSAQAGTTAKIVVLAQAAPDLLARQPGLARRLRPVTITLGGVGASPLEVPLYEGRPTASAAHLFVLGVAPGSRGWTAALLGAAAGALVGDGVIRADVVIGWGDASAGALAALPAARRLLVVPDGRAGAPLGREERDFLAADPHPEGAELSDSLLGWAVMEADAVAVPSPSAATALASEPALAERPSDQPLAVVRLGCDEPPNDPASDPALPHHYSAAAPAGKAECRKALARRLSLAVGPRTLVVVAPPLTAGGGSETLLATLGQLAGLDVAVILAGSTDRTLGERARVLAIQNPGRMALLEDAGINLRELLAGADAAVFTAGDELTAQAAGLALRYGALPLAPDAGACGDFLVDYDAGSGTGSALLYAAGDAFELTGTLRRAAALRTDRERWDALLVSVLNAAPSWSTTAARLGSLADEAAKEVPSPLLA